MKYKYEPTKITFIMKNGLRFEIENEEPTDPPNCGCFNEKSELYSNNNKRCTFETHMIIDSKYVKSAKLLSREFYLDTLNGMFDKIILLLDEATELEDWNNLFILGGIVSREIDRVKEQIKTIKNG